MAGFREDAFDRVLTTLQASAKVYSIKLLCSHQYVFFLLSSLNREAKSHSTLP